MPRSLLYLAVFLPSLAPPTAGFSQGAGSASCEEMRPGHISAQPRDVGGAGVSVRTSARSFLPGQLVTVTVRSSRDFMGFLLQARRASGPDGDPVLAGGSWTAAPPGTHTLRCLSDGDTLTHSDKQLKRNLSFVWRAPDVPAGDIRFHVTVVRSYFVFWAGIQSAVLHDMSGAGAWVPRGSSGPALGATPGPDTSDRTGPSAARRPRTPAGPGPPGPTSREAGLRPSSSVPTSGSPVSLAAPWNASGAGAAEAFMTWSFFPALVHLPSSTLEISSTPPSQPASHPSLPPLSHGEGGPDSKPAVGSSVSEGTRDLWTTSAVPARDRPLGETVPAGPPEDRSSPSRAREGWSSSRTGPGQPGPGRLLTPPTPALLLEVRPFTSEGGLQSRRWSPSRSPALEDLLRPPTPPASRLPPGNGPPPLHRPTSDPLKHQQQTSRERSDLLPEGSSPPPPAAQTSRWTRPNPPVPPGLSVQMVLRPEVDMVPAPDGGEEAGDLQGAGSVGVLLHSFIQTLSSHTSSPSLSFSSPPAASAGSTPPSTHGSPTSTMSSLGEDPRSSRASGTLPGPSPDLPPPPSTSVHPWSTSPSPGLPRGPSSPPAPPAPSAPSPSPSSSPSSSSLVPVTAPSRPPSLHPRSPSSTPLLPSSPFQKLTLRQSQRAWWSPAAPDRRARPDPKPGGGLGFGPGSPAGPPSGPPGGSGTQELGLLLGCSAGLGMVLVVAVRFLCHQARGKRTAVMLNSGRGGRGLIRVQECGDLVRVRPIRENSFVLLAQYDILTSPGN